MAPFCVLRPLTFVVFSPEKARYSIAMRLFLLTTLTMTAFAANSVLNRVAIDSGAIDPASFAVVRVLTGAVVLVVFVRARGGVLPLWQARRAIGAGSLVLYMIGFSGAYMTLDAGLGALILFGVVQITMFTFSAIRGTAPMLRQIVGATIAMGGLAWVLWPSGQSLADPVGAALMVAAGAGWAIYSLAGRSEPDALSGTAANFCLALPLVLVSPLLLPGSTVITMPGLALAAMSGGVTSGLGYALWYSVVPRFTPSTAATVQLVAPVIALVGGVVLLEEPASLRLALATLLVLGGIGLSIRRE